MSDEEDPYAVSSDSEDEKGPPPKIAIDREADLSKIKESLAADESKVVKNEKTLEEMEQLRQQKAAAVKKDFEEGRVTNAEAGGSTICDELAQLKEVSLKEKKENWAASVAEAQSGGAKPNEELEEIRSQVSEVKAKWRTGELEVAEVQEDEAKKEELEALKKQGINIKERFQPPGEGTVLKSYDRSELDTSAAADARKSFVEGKAFEGTKAESAAASELGELKFTGMNAFKNKFERGEGDMEEVEKARVELDLQLNELRKTFEKAESEMSPEERAEKKKAEIEAEFSRYKLARKVQAQRAVEQGADTSELPQGDIEEEYDVKNLMNKFKNIEQLTGKEREKNLEELEALRMEAKNLRQQFEQANQLESSEVSEEKRRQLEEEFKQLKEEREHAKKELEAEQAEEMAVRNAEEKEEIGVAADHASKMTAKWEKIHKKEAKKAEKGKMPQK